MRIPFLALALAAVPSLAHAELQIGQVIVETVSAGCAGTTNLSSNLPATFKPHTDAPLIGSNALAVFTFGSAQSYAIPAATPLNTSVPVVGAALFNGVTTFATPNVIPSMSINSTVVKLIGPSRFTDIKFTITDFQGIAGCTVDLRGSFVNRR